MPVAIRAPTIAWLPIRDPAMRNHLAIAAIVVLLVAATGTGTGAAEPKAGEVLALVGQCFVETGGRRIR